MTLDKNNPSLLGKIGVWGRPWHGLVEGGVLTLPNDSTMAHPQPGGSRHWEYTAAHVLQVPGTPAVVRSPEQQTADTAVGRQWLDKAIISGGNSMLYGVPLGAGRFVWADETGARWLVDASALHGQSWSSATVPTSVQITVKPFGRLGVAEQPPTPITVTVPSLGQSSPPLYDVSTEITTFSPSLFSLNRTGSAATFMLHYQLTRAWLAERWPCGWFELQLSLNEGVPTAQIVLLHDRLSTLGGNTQTTSGYVDACSPPADSGPGYALWVAGTQDDQQNGSCTGYLDQVYTAVASRSDLSATHARYWPTSWPDSLMQDQTCAEWYSGMVVAIWYDDAGARKTLTLDARWDRQWNVAHVAPSALEIGRVRQDQTGTPGACDLNPAGYVYSQQEYQYAITQTGDETFTWSMKLDGVTVDSAVERAQTTKSFTVTTKNAYGELLEVLESFTVTSDHPRRATDSVPETGVSSNTYQPSNNAPTSPSALLRREMEPGKRASNFARLYGGNILFTAKPARVGHDAFAWLFARAVSSASVATWSIPGAVLTPAGQSAFAATSWDETYGSNAGMLQGIQNRASKTIHVARNPISGEIAAADGTPCCWV